MDFDGAGQLESALRGMGELLAHEGQVASIVIVGGAAMNLLGVIERGTRDVDVLAVRKPGSDTALAPPDPLPPAVQRAIGEVARAFDLREDWMNTVVAGQWRLGLPPGLEDRVQWRRYGGLEVGIADRLDLVHFKLYAGADQTGPGSVHMKDLLALRPTRAELETAGAWVKAQDPSPDYHDIVDRVIRYVLERT